jgi:hypothetical protein
MHTPVPSGSTVHSHSRVSRSRAALERAMSASARVRLDGAGGQAAVTNDGLNLNPSPRLLQGIAIGPSTLDTRGPPREIPASATPPKAFIDHGGVRLSSRDFGLRVRNRRGACVDRVGRWYHHRSPPRRWSEDAVVPSEVRSGTRDERDQLLDQLARRQDEMRGPVPSDQVCFPTR